MTKTVKAWLLTNRNGTPIRDGLFVYESQLEAHAWCGRGQRIVPCTITYEVPEPAKKGKKR